ncbi:unnamed protein product [Lampetra planeri]
MGGARWPAASTCSSSPLASWSHNSPRPRLSSLRRLDRAATCGGSSPGGDHAIVACHFTCRRALLALGQEAYPHMDRAALDALEVERLLSLVQELGVVQTIDHREQ